MRYIAIACAAVAASSILSFPIVAHAKTAKECREEWRANKAEYQAKKITEKAYVTQCEAGTATAAPAAAPASSRSSKTENKTAPASASAKKTAKECREEWQANKAANQAKGIKERDYVKQCEAGATAAAPPAPAAAPKSSNTENKTAPMSAPTARTSAPSAPAAASAPTGANQYSTEAQAKIRCGTGTVVWANLNSKIYHFAGHKDYGHTKSGAYMCERDATSQGIRAAKDEKHP